MKLKWQQAPVKTQWGDDMVVASVAIDKDHTVDLYCERDQASKVEAMFAQQEPVGCEGAIVNGRVYADRLAHDYKFECEAGPLHLCTDWVEFRRCFEWLAQHTAPPAQRTWVGLTDEEKRDIAVEECGTAGLHRSVWEMAFRVAEQVEIELKEKNS